MAAAVGPVCRGRGLAAGQSGVTLIVCMTRVIKMEGLSHGVARIFMTEHRTSALLTGIKAIWRTNGGVPALW